MNFLYLRNAGKIKSSALYTCFCQCRRLHYRFTRMRKGCAPKLHWPPALPHSEDESEAFQAVNGGMKTLFTLALAAIALTILGFVFSAGASSPLLPAPAEKTDILSVKAPAPKPAPAPTNKPKILEAKPGPNPILEALRADDLCALLKLKAQDSSFTKNDGAALLETIDPSPALREVLSPDGPLFVSEAKKPFSGKAARMLWALRQAGLLYGFPVPAGTNATTALATISQLEKEDGGNSFVTLVRLQLEMQRKEKPEVLKETAAKLAAQSRFENYIEELQAEAHEARWLSVTLYNEINSVTYPVFNSFGVYYLTAPLQDLLDKDSLVRFGELLMEKASRSTKTVWSEEFNPDQYDAGRILTGSTGPSIWEISAEREKREGITAPNAPYINLNLGCDTKPMEEFFYLNRGRY